MGWSYYPKDEVTTKRELFKRLSRPDSFNQERVELMKNTLVGEHHWYLIKMVESGKVSIGLNLFDCDGGEWGYKSMSEECGPYYYDCPLGFLKEASETSCETTLEWRENVRKFHAEKKSKANRSSALKAGDVIDYFGDVFELVYKRGPRKGWNVSRKSSGQLFSMSSKQINESVILTQ